MHLKKYEVDSISEAMVRIKDDFGPDAVILSSRRIRRDGSSKIEIVAARDREDAVAVRPEDVPSEPSPEPVRERPVREEPETSHRWRRFEARLDDINDTMVSFAALLGSAGDESLHGLSPVHRLLLSRGLSTRSAARLVEAFRAEQGDSRTPLEAAHQKQLLKRVISRSVAAAMTERASRGRQRIQAFVGPAGDGKTTTLAKIAARIRYRDKKTLGIITMDDFRIGAVEQLKIYGTIMDVPLLALAEGDDLVAALKKFDHLEEVLIDTAGRSRTDDEHISRLKRAFTGERPVETNLVVSATAETKAMTDTVRRFKPLDFERVVVTKVDDAFSYGCLFNIIDLAGCPVSHITTGQQVPGDIRAMDSDGIARLIVDREIPRH